MQTGEIVRGPPQAPQEMNDHIFYLKFWMSVASASFGISKFLKSGPCQIIKDTSFLMGYGSLSYILLLINITTTLFARAQITVLLLLYTIALGQWDGVKILIPLVLLIQYLAPFPIVSYRVSNKKCH